MAGSTQTQVTFTIINDNIEEVDLESFNVQLSLLNAPSGVVIGNSEGTITIVDEDGE